MSKSCGEKGRWKGVVKDIPPPAAVIALWDYQQGRTDEKDEDKHKDDPVEDIRKDEALR